jgi:delta 1-pyrroline-5-carboxylate dehydrogenase
MTQLQHNVPTATAGNLAANNASRDAQRQAASAQLKQATQRSNYRGYDSTPTSTQQRREAAKTQLKNPRRSNSSVGKPLRAASRT